MMDSTVKVEQQDKKPVVSSETPLPGVPTHTQGIPPRDASSSYYPQPRRARAPLLGCVYASTCEQGQRGVSGVAGSGAGMRCEDAGRDAGRNEGRDAEGCGAVTSVRRPHGAEGLAGAWPAQCGALHLEAPGSAGWEPGASIRRSGAEAAAARLRSGALALRTPAPVLLLLLRLPVLPLPCSGLQLRLPGSWRSAVAYSSGNATSFPALRVYRLSMQ